VNSNMVDIISTMKEKSPIDLNQRIAQRVRDLRAQCGYSLDVLSTRSGVSRSMLSLVERGESSPTAVVLERIATGLNVTLASLFENPQATPEPIARYADQLLWQDPHSGYVRRNVTPAGPGAAVQIVEVLFPPQARVMYESSAREPVVQQQIWVLDGTMEVTLGTTTHTLHTGDCLAMVLNQTMAYHNPTQHTARYAVVIANLAKPWSP
jgi:transcriptional regulator with XRE-family HTH domain